MVINPYRSEVKRVGKSGGAPDVARPYRSGKSVFDTVGERETFVIAGKSLHGDDGTEALLLD